MPINSWITAVMFYADGFFSCQTIHELSLNAFNIFNGNHENLKPIEKYGLSWLFFLNFCKIKFLINNFKILCRNIFNCFISQYAFKFFKWKSLQGTKLTIFFYIALDAEKLLWSWFILQHNTISVWQDYCNYCGNSYCKYKKITDHV